MAEALSLAANIIAVIHITTEVIQRLNDFRNTVNGIPRALQAIANELPTLDLALKKITEAIADGRIPEDSQNALQPLIADFGKQIQAILDIIKKVQPKDPSRMTRNFKAVTSFRHDGQIKYHESVIRGYSQTLQLERIVSGPAKDVDALQCPLVPTFMCPFGPNPDFINRSLLIDIHAQRQPGSRHALVGGAGMGKSQLAIRYGYKVQEDAPDTWIFWVNATTATSLEQGYREIANTVRIPERNVKGNNIISLVYEWLRNDSNGKWVLILDNADDKDVFTNRSPNDTSADPKQLRDYLPQSPNGSILVTSRSRDAAFEVTCNYKTIISVEQMTETEAIELFDSHLQELHPENEKKLLVETLGYVPLAVSQAASNISRRSLPIPDYLEELRKSNEASASLLDESLPQLHRESSRSNSIVTTWKVTFEYVRRTAPSAARLLSLMCLFDRQNISETLLKGKYGEEVTMPPPKPYKPWWRRRPRTRKRKERMSSAKTTPSDFEDDWLVLRDFSMIALNKDRRHFSMHPIVQYTTRKWLSLHGELDTWKQQCVSIMEFVFPATPLNDELCLSLVSHAYAAIVYRPSDTALEPLRTWASLTDKTGRYTTRISSLNLTEKLYRISAEAYTICLEPSAPPVLRILSQRGCILEMLYRYPEAEVLQRHILALRTKTIGPEHLDTLETSDHLAHVLAQQDRFDKAEALYLHTLSTRSRTLGEGHAATQNSLSNLVSFYWQHSRLNDAYTMARRAHESKLLVRSNANVVGNKTDKEYYKSLTLIGLSHMMRGASSAAEKCLREALDEREKASDDGDGDEALVEILVHLARSLAEQGKYGEAAPLLQRAIPLFAAIQQSERLAASTQLAEVLLELGRLGEAHEVAANSLAERSDLNGANDKEAYEVMWVLASVLEKQGKCEDAVEMYRKAYEGTKEVLGAEHVDTKEFEKDYRALVERMEGQTGHRLGRESSSSDVSEDHEWKVYEEHTIAGAEDDEKEIEVDRKVSHVVSPDHVIGAMHASIAIAAN